MMKQIIFLFILFFFANLMIAQNVGINSTGAAPSAAAMLDIAATDKGVLVPRVALTALNVASPITTTTLSLLVFNTATAGTGATAVFPGFYYWDGVSSWVALAGNGGKNWALLGNAGTVAGTNFLGTTDNVDLQFRVNNIQGGKINIASNQTFFGYKAGLVATGTANSFFGVNSGIANAGGTHNTAVGYLTFTTSTSGSFNTTVGYGSMRSNLSGSNNTFLGTNAGANWSASSNNTGVGMFALQGLGAGTGVGNTALGYAAGSGTTPNNFATGNGSYNTFLGYNAAVNNSAFSNATAVGANALAGASDVLILGSINGTNGATTDTKVGIGTITPASSNLGLASVNKLNVTSSNNVASVGVAEFSNTSANGLVLITGNTGVTNIYNGMFGYSAYTGNAFVPCGIIGQITTSNGTGAGVGVRGDGFSSTHYGVRGAIPTTGTWSGLGGLFSGGLGYVNGIYNLSDRRVKKDIKEITNPLEIIMSLDGIYYKYNTDVLKSAKGDNRTYIGFIAQDVEKVCPEIVATKNIPLGSDDGINPANLPEKANFLEAKVVDYVQLVPVLVEAIKEQQKQLEELRNEIKKLKEK